MSALVIVGAQWGDEGKGKVTDLLAAQARAVVRFQGGNNAGHTILVAGKTFKLHLVPSGVLQPGVTSLIGNGVVVDLEALVKELDELVATGVSTKDVLVAAQAHVLLPTHRALDLAQEKKRGKAAIGTTGRGIGPAYKEKVARTGLRIGDLGDATRTRAILTRHVETHGAELEGSGLSVEALITWAAASWKRIAPHVVDGPVVVNRLLDQGARVLLEGAQGTLLDVDHGTYPFVTSSSPTAGGACTGSGVGPLRIGAVLGVSKAYTTRVGSGPFPTEETGEFGHRLREKGHEYGATTGRPRRCGWLDLALLRHAVRVNGLSHLALTKLDTLGDLGPLKVCTHYTVDGERRDEVPHRIDELERAVPVYETWPGWKEQDLGPTEATWPTELRAYIAGIEKALGIPVALVGLGAARESTVVRSDLWAAADARSR